MQCTAAAVQRPQSAERAGRAACLLLQEAQCHTGPWTVLPHNSSFPLRASVPYDG